MQPGTRGLLKRPLAAPGWRRGRAGAAVVAAAVGATLSLQACGAAPKMAAAAEQAKIAQQASPAGDAAVQALAGQLTVIGSAGKALSPAERERLIRQLGSEGSAASLRRHLAAMASTEGVELYAGNQAQVLVDGPATFDAMFKAIAAARRSVLVESYIVEDAEIAQRLADALIAKRRQGLQVALLYDGLGSIGTDDKYFDRLRAAGVGVCAFNPIKPGDRATGQAPTHRDHRKIVTVDRLIGFTGGINISAVYSSGSFGGGGRKAPPPPKKKEGKDGKDDAGWRDTHVQLRGPVAAALDDLIRQTWRDQRCDEGTALAALEASADATPAAVGNDVVRIVSSSPDDEMSRIYALLLSTISASQRQVHLTMAYFAPGDEMVDALCEAARRGVDVQLVLPSRSDFAPVLHAGRSYYSRMLEAGIRVHELQGSVLHAKTGVIDGVLSTIGSSNLDFRSFEGNNEVNAVVLGEDFGDAMERLFREDLKASREITREAWSNRTVMQRVKEAAAALLERWW